MTIFITINVPSCYHVPGTRDDAFNGLAEWNSDFVGWFRNCEITGSTLVVNFARFMRCIPHNCTPS